jgi:dipeptide/tripeptide permease
LIISFAPLLGGLAGVTYGYAVRYISVTYVLAVSGILMGTGIFVITFAPSAPIILLGCAIVGLGGGLFEPSCVSKIFRRSPVRVHALAMGLNVCAISLGQFAHPIIVETLRNRFGLEVAFSVLGLSMIVIAIIVASRNRPAIAETRGAADLGPTAHIG